MQHNPSSIPEEAASMFAQHALVLDELVVRLLAKPERRSAAPPAAVHWEMYQTQSTR